MNNILQGVYSALDIIVFRCNKQGNFNLVSNVPAWLLFFLADREDPEQAYSIFDIFPYLSFFQEEAEAHWQSKNTTVLGSGPWIELDALENEVALEVYVFWLAGERILLLKNLGKHYIDELTRLQQVRSGLLTNEMLESEVLKRTLEVRRREEEIAIKLVSLTSYRDEETGSHVRRIGLYAAAMAKALRWSNDDIAAIRMAAPMHDIGKIGVPDHILRKNGALNDQEFSIMKKHTEMGARMLGGTNIAVLDMAADIARCHHERWDGSGYPYGLSGEQIPIAARITTIVDIYDALVHKRVYKAAFPEHESLALMTEMSGQYLDPHLFDLFIRLLPVMRQIRMEVQEGEELSNDLVL